MVTQLVNHWREWAISGGILIGAVILALIVHKILFIIASRLVKRTGSVIDNSLVKHGRGPGRLILPLLALFRALPATSLPPGPMGNVRHGLALGMIAAVAWMLIVLIDVFEDIALKLTKAGGRARLTSARCAGIRQSNSCRREPATTRQNCTSFQTSG